MARVSILPLLVLMQMALPTHAGSGGDLQSFDEFLVRYRSATPEVRSELARDFVAGQRSRAGFPIIGEDGEVIFFYLAASGESSVRLVGDFKTRDFNSPLWDGAGEPLAAATPGGGVFSRRMKFEEDARLEYQFVVDGKFVVDPLNPRSVVSGAAPSAGKDGTLVSDLVMPRYRVTEKAVTRPGVPRGRTFTVDEPWAKPKITVHLPAGYSRERRYPVLYVADGTAWAKIIGLPTMLDNLTADRVTEPAIAVMIDPIEDRSGWYMFNSSYLGYLEKVVAWVDAHLSSRADARGRVHVGSSAGGRVSLSVVLERPELFGNAALFSPSLTAPPHYYEPYFSGRKHLDSNLRIWLSAGTYEGYIHQDALMLERYLATAGIKMKTTYTHEGHSLAAWRNLAPQMLGFFFPRRS